jgi:hypothetical protein
VRFVGAATVAGSALGTSVAISDDGNTVAAGAPGDDSGVGAVYLLTRSGTTWTQQARLTPTGAAGDANLGASCAISANGNIAVVGAEDDAGGTGALFVFTRSGATWTQDGNKLTPIGAIGNGHMGYAVTLSADGATALCGARFDDSNLGAAYIFRRSGGAWAQLGAKLVPVGASTGTNYFGNAVSIGAGGTRAVIGARADSADRGAFYIFDIAPCCGGLQHDFKQVSTASGATRFGMGVAFDATGQYAAIGAPHEDSLIGTTYFYDLYSSPALTQQPESAVVAAGDAAVFAVSANPAAGVTYYWRRNGVPLSNGSMVSGAVISGATSATLTVTNTTLEDSGAVFDCVVTWPCGSLASSPASLIVNPACPADFNLDGFLNPDDLADYITTFFISVQLGC